MKHLLFLALVGLLLSSARVQAAQVGPRVGLIGVDGSIGPSTADYISRAVDVAAAQDDECLVIQLDTPGGLLQSTKKIVETLYTAKTPIVVYVSPSGASAASAGVFITLAANVAAMAPNTTIGAAHPVQLGLGGADHSDKNDVMAEKMANYASSFIETIADKRNRNVKWAKDAVLESKATTAETAIQLKVVDLIAPDLTHLLQQLNGRTVNGKILKTSGAQVVEIPMTLSERLFRLLWQPQVMMILMLIAVYGIITELCHPGVILPGVVGMISLILLLYMSETLPLNIAGVALVLLSVALFLTDIFAPTHGVLTAGGIVSFFVGAIMMFNRAAPAGGLPMSWVLPATASTAAFFIFFASKGIRAQYQPVKCGKEAMIGKVIKTQSPVDSAGGSVWAEGHLWNATSEMPVGAGQRVKIVGIEGLTLKVKPLG